MIFYLEISTLYLTNRCFCDKICPSQTTKRSPVMSDETFEDLGSTEGVEKEKTGYSWKNVVINISAISIFPIILAFVVIFLILESPIKASGAEMESNHNFIIANPIKDFSSFEENAEKKRFEHLKKSPQDITIGDFKDVLIPEVPEAWRDDVVAAAREYDVPISLLSAFGWKESNWRPWLSTVTKRESSHGPFQINVRYHIKYGMTASKAKTRNSAPYYAAKLLKEAIGYMKGDVFMGVQAYNNINNVGIPFLKEYARRIILKAYTAGRNNLEEEAKLLDKLPPISY